MILAILHQETSLLGHYPHVPVLGIPGGCVPRYLRQDQKRSHCSSIVKVECEHVEQGKDGRYGTHPLTGKQALTFSSPEIMHFMTSEFALHASIRAQSFHVL